MESKLREDVKTKFEAALKKSISYSSCSIVIAKFSNSTFPKGYWILQERIFDTSQGPEYTSICIITLEEAKELYRHPLVSLYGWSTASEEKELTSEL